MKSSTEFTSSHSAAWGRGAARKFPLKLAGGISWRVTGFQHSARVSSLQMGLQTGDNCDGWHYVDTCSPSAGHRLAATEAGEQSPDGNGFQFLCIFCWIWSSTLDKMLFASKTALEGTRSSQRGQIKRFVNEPQNSLCGRSLLSLKFNQVSGSEIAT